MTTGLTVVIGEVSAGHDILSLLGERLFWAVLLGTLGLWLMLPRGATWGRTLGAVVSAVSLGLFASHVPQLADWVERGVFWILSGMTILAAAATISARSPVYSAIWFALTLLGTAGLFLYQGAQFLGVATVVVYAGAIVVTLLFVLMLAQPAGHAFYDRIGWGSTAAAFAALASAAFVGILTPAIAALNDTNRAETHRQIVAAFSVAAGEQAVAARVTNRDGGKTKLAIDVLDRAAFISLAGGREEIEQRLAASLQIEPDRLELSIESRDVLAEQHVARLGGRLFSRHLVSVEVAGTLLLAALVGAVAIVIHGRRPPATEEQHGDG